MAENVKIQNPNQTVDQEFTHEPVPQNKRRAFVSLLVVYLGLVFVVTSMQAGGLVGQGLKFDQAIGATLVSSLILTVLGTFVGFAAFKSGLTFSKLSQYSFGMIGTFIPIAIVVLTTIGWFSIDAWLIGSTTNTLFSKVPLTLIIILSGIGMAVTALKGMNWMTMLSNLAVPLIAIFGIISIVIAIRDSGGFGGIMAINPEKPMAFADGVSLGVGSFAVGAIMFTPDVLRFAKSKKSVFWVLAISLILGNTFVMLMGMTGTIAYKQPDIAQVLKVQGMLAPAFLVLLLNIWSTAQGCVYSGSLSLSTAFPKFKREHFVIAFGLVGIIFALVGFYNYFGDYINLLAATVPTLAGVLIADYFTIYRAGYPARHQHKTIDILAFISWVAGVLVLMFVKIGMPTLNGILVSFLLRIILNMVFVKKTA